MAQQPVVGTLYNPDDSVYRPKFTQPGGPGTQVFPAQSPGEIVGLFIFGCGHGFNNIDIKFTSVAGVQVAVLCCPVCCYCQRIISPASDLYSFQNEIVLA